MKEEEPTFKKIHIQALENREHAPTSSQTKQELAHSLNQKYLWSRKPILCYNDSGLSPERLVFSMNGLSNFFHAFEQAYVNHGDIVLIPDEVWIMISLFVSKYIDKNAEKLRHKLVKFEGAKTLTVVEAAKSVEESLLMEHKWDTFFEEIILLIEKETVEGVTKCMQCDFSTTNKVYKLISTSIIMNSFKSFFKYERMLAGCGINNAYMGGVREDWLKIKEKLLMMRKFDVDGGLKEYVAHMSIILDNFLLTFDGCPDVKWWNTIMTTPEKRQFYMQEQILVEGWILYFFGIYKNGDAGSLPDFSVKVPIKLINTYTKVTKHLMLVADWVSISKLNERTYKPDIGMSIAVKEEEGKNNLNNKQRNLIKNLEKIYKVPAKGLKTHTPAKKEVPKPVKPRANTLAKKKHP